MESKEHSGRHAVQLDFAEEDIHVRRQRLIEDFEMMPSSNVARLAQVVVLVDHSAERPATVSGAAHLAMSSAMAS